MNINITADGELRFIYADDLQPLLELGTPQVRRASHVEPTDGGQWTADMSPVCGSVLGPFTLRSEALTAETEWLSKHGF